jgi:hypothetical protein
VSENFTVASHGRLLECLLLAESRHSSPRGDRDRGPSLVNVRFVPKAVTQHDCPDCFRLERKCRVGFSPTEKHRLITAHTLKRRSLATITKMLAHFNIDSGVSVRNHPDVALKDICQCRNAKIKNIIIPWLRRALERKGNFDEDVHTYTPTGGLGRSSLTLLDVSYRSVRQQDVTFLQ